MKKIKFTKLKDYNVPYSVYIDANTILTTNNDLVRTIKIFSWRKKDSTDETIRGIMQKAIASLPSNYRSILTFWIHDIRVQNPQINKFLTHDDYNSNDFLRFFEQSTKQNSQSIKNHETFLYVSFTLRIPKEKSTFIKNILNAFSFDFITNDKVANIKTQHAIMNNIVKHVITFASKKGLQYEQVGIKKNLKGEYVSENIKIINQIAGFKKHSFPVPMTYLHKAIDHYYHFDFGLISQRYVDDKGNRHFRYSTIFTIKDNNYITGKSVNLLISQLDEAVLFEVNHPCSYSEAEKKYRDTKDLSKKTYNSWETHEMNEATKINEIVSHDEEKMLQYYRQYLGIIVYANSNEELQKTIVQITTVAKVLGLHLTREDIGTERAFYSAMPGNFSYINHTTIASEKQIFQFAYSHAFDNLNIKQYISEEPVCILPTISFNAYAFGILRDKPDIVISTNSNRYAISMLNYFSLKCLCAYEGSTVYQIDLGDNSLSLAKIIKGEAIRPANGDKISFYHHSCYTTEEYQEFIEYLLVSAGVPDQETGTISMEMFASYERSDNPMEQIRQAAIRAGKEVHEVMEKYLGEKSEFAKVADPAKPRYKKNIFTTYGINIRKQAQPSQMFAMLSLYDMYSRLTADKRPKIISLSNINIIASNLGMASIAKKILALPRENSMIFMGLSNIDWEQNWHLSFEEIMKHCDTHIHNFDLRLQQHRREKFAFSDIEWVALNKSISIKNSFFLKQGGLAVVMRNSILKDNLAVIKEILADSEDFQKQIKKIQSDLNIANNYTLLKAVQQYLETGIATKSTKNEDLTEEEREELRLKKEKAEALRRIESYATEIVESS